MVEQLLTWVKWDTHKHNLRSWEIAESLQWQDYYLLNRPRQPKADIADYIEQNWILVPRRFNNLKEALESWKDFIIRSEQRREYNWASGLLESMWIILSKKDLWFRHYKWEFNSLDEIFQNILKYWWRKSRSILWYICGNLDSLSQDEVENAIKLNNYQYIDIYCLLLWIDKEEFTKNISFSYWELLWWYNRSIIADSSVKWRYYIYTHGGNTKNICVYDNGSLIINWFNSSEKQSNISQLPKKLIDWISGVIEFYEKIRNLPRFNSNHCPLIEFQTYDWDNYFLQYHRTRDFQSADFVLNRDLEQDEFEVDIVRWITPKDGLELDLVVHYWKFDIRQEDWTISERSQNEIFDEIMSRKRILKAIPYWLDHFVACSMVWWHWTKSDYFNPQLSLVIPKVILKYSWDKVYWQYTHETWKDSIMRVRVISDWRKAYIKFLWNNLSD